MLLSNITTHTEPFIFQVYITQQWEHLTKAKYWTNTCTCRCVFYPEDGHKDRMHTALSAGDTESWFRDVYNDPFNAHTFIKKDN